MICTQKEVVRGGNRATVTCACTVRRKVELRNGMQKYAKLSPQEGPTRPKGRETGRMKSLVSNGRGSGWTNEGWREKAATQ